MTAAISVRNLGKVYETKSGLVEAVKDVSFDVRRGEFVSLVGPSGCGKSTILHIVAGLLDHTGGSVEVAGAPARSGRRDVGIMLQRPVLMPWRSVLDNVLLPAELFKLDKRTARARAEELLELVGLESFAHKHVWELSGGMQQRASLARVLVAEPDILLMDEPFSALDEFTRERLNAELARLHESLGRSSLYVTHHISEAVFLSDRVVVLKPRPGEVVEIVEVTIPRPRQIRSITSHESTELAASIRDLLGFRDQEASA
ncbi:MAG: ABC transporter ATP-binding protein [Nocardioides sp.]|uniref:ABC transporter ATP-binding protein n=1 Tax=Nocardioides sp. TaxID=35761 RepID=UPI0039E46B45